METESNQNTKISDNGTNLELSPGTPDESGPGDGPKTSEETLSQLDRGSDGVALCQASTDAIPVDHEISHSEILEEDIPDEQQNQEVDASSGDVMEPDPIDAETADPAMESTTEQAVGSTRIDSCGSGESRSADGNARDPVTPEKTFKEEAGSTDANSAYPAMDCAPEETADLGGSTKVDSSGSGEICSADGTAQDPVTPEKTFKEEAGSTDANAESLGPAMDCTTEQASDAGGSTRMDSSVNSGASCSADGNAQDPVTSGKTSKAVTKSSQNPQKISNKPLAPSKAVSPQNSWKGMSDEEIMKVKQRIKELAVPSGNPKTHNTHGFHPNREVSKNTIGKILPEVAKRFRREVKFLVMNCGINPDIVLREFKGDVKIEKQKRKENMALAKEFKHIYPPHPFCEHSLGEIVKLACQHVPHCLGISSRRIFIYRCYVAGMSPKTEYYHHYLLGPTWLDTEGVHTVKSYANEYYSEYEFLRPAKDCKYDFLEIKRMADEIPEPFRKKFFFNCYINGKDPTAEDWTTYESNRFDVIAKRVPHKNCKLPFADIKKLADKIPDAYGLEERLIFCRKCYMEGKDPNSELERYAGGKSDNIKSTPVSNPPKPIVDPYADSNWMFPHPECKLSFKDIKKKAERIPKSLGPYVRKRYVHHCYVDGKDPVLEDWTQYDDDPYYEFNYKQPAKKVRYSLAELKRLADTMVPESFGIDARKYFILRCWKYNADPHKEDMKLYADKYLGNKPFAEPKPHVPNESVNKPKKPSNKTPQVQSRMAGNSEHLSGGDSMDQLINMADQIKSRISLISSFGSNTSCRTTGELKNMAEQIDSRIKLISNLDSLQKLNEELKANNSVDTAPGSSGFRDNTNRSSYQDKAGFSGNAPSSRGRQVSGLDAKLENSLPGGGSTTRNRQPYSEDPNRSLGVAGTSLVSGGPSQDGENRINKKKIRRVRPKHKNRLLNSLKASESSSAVKRSTTTALLPTPSTSVTSVPSRNVVPNYPPILWNETHQSDGSLQGPVYRHSQPDVKPALRPPRPVVKPALPPPRPVVKPALLPPRPIVKPALLPAPGILPLHLTPGLVSFPPPIAGFSNNTPPPRIPYNIPPNTMPVLGGPFTAPPMQPTVQTTSWNPVAYPVAPPPQALPATVPSMQPPNYPCPPSFNIPSPAPRANDSTNNTRGSSHIDGPPRLESSSSSQSLKRKTTYEDPIPPKKTATVKKIGNKSSTMLYIVHSEHPRIRLSDEEMDAIENSILEAILEFDNDLVKPSFQESSRSDGRYGVVCNDEFTENWLFTFLRETQPWPNAWLKIITKEPASIRANAVLPLCRDDNDKILKFIGKQNVGLDTSKWEVIERWESGESKTCLNLMVDEESAEVLQRSRRVNFKLGSGIVIAPQTRELARGDIDEVARPSETPRPSHRPSGYVLYDSASMPSVGQFPREGTSQEESLSQNWHASGTNYGTMQAAAVDRFRKLVAAGFSSEKAMVFTQAYVRRQSASHHSAMDHPHQQSNAPTGYPEWDPSVEEPLHEAHDMLKWFQRN